VAERADERRAGGAVMNAVREVRPMNAAPEARPMNAVPEACR